MRCPAISRFASWWAVFSDITSWSDHHSIATELPDLTWHQRSRRGVIVIFDVQVERRQYEMIDPDVLAA